METFNKKIPSEMEVALRYTLTVHTVYTIQMALLYTPLNMYAYIQIGREGNNAIGNCSAAAEQNVGLYGWTGWKSGNPLDCHVHQSTCGAKKIKKNFLR